MPIRMSKPDPPIETAVWRIASYRRLWFGTVLMALATQCERLAMGWFVLTETDSVFLTATAFAVQKAPGSLFAPFAGYISDRVSRSRMLAVTALYKTVILSLLAFLAMDQVESLWPVFILVAFSGISRCFETPATQGLITETVPKQMAMRAISVQSTGSKAVGALGGLAGGVVIAALGIPTALFSGAVVFVLGALVMMTLPRGKSERQASGSVGSGVLHEAVKGLLLVIRLPVVGALLLTAFVVEMFGFAYGSVLPSVARDVLRVDADGLGAMTLMAGCGSVIGVVVLAMLGNYHRKGLLLIGATLGYGLLLVGFASSKLFPLSLVLILGVGAMAAVFDVIQWTLLQQHVPEDRRGQAIGGWVFATGLGWMGQIMLGGAAEFFGVQWALAGAGGLVVLMGLTICVTSLRKV